MSKNKIITTLIICAVLFTGLASFLVYRYMSPSRGTIYVFANSYSAGTQIDANMLLPMQVDSSIILAGKKDKVGTQFVTPSEYSEVVRSGDSLRMDVNAGMPLTSSMLSVSGGSSLEMNMRSDAIAVTISVDRFTGVTNDLKEGARVNIYSNINGSTTLIQQNKRILEAFHDSNGTIIGVSIEENLDESMELINAETNGSIYLGLVDATGYQASEGVDPVYSPFAENTVSQMVAEPEPEAEIQTEADKSPEETVFAP